MRDVGVNINVRDVFGKPKEPQERHRGLVSVEDLTEKIKNDLYSDIKKGLFLNFKDEFFSELKEMWKKENGFCSVGTTQSVHMPSEQPRCDRNSVHSVDLYPFAHIKDPIKCRLVVMLNGQSTLVAKGRIYQSSDDTIVGNELLLPNHVMVMVDMIVDGGERFYLPVPTKFRDRVGDDIVGSFLQWPIELVGVEEDDMSNKVGKNEQSNQQGDQSATGIRPPLVDDADLECLGPYGKELHSVLRLVSQSADYFESKLDVDVFHHSNSRAIFVFIKHIIALMKMDWLSVSIIQIFILYLH